jgi:hypothetical protein
MVLHRPDIHLSLEIDRPDWHPSEHKIAANHSDCIGRDRSLSVRDDVSNIFKIDREL